MLPAALRVMTGLLLLGHGAGKILGFPDLSATKPLPGAPFVPTGLID